MNELVELCYFPFSKGEICLFDARKLSSEVPSGRYPTIIKQPGGRAVPVVQAFAFTKYLGSVILTIDGQGEVSQINGKPILLDSSFEQSRALKCDKQLLLSDASLIYS